MNEVYIYIVVAMDRPAPFGSLEDENVLGPTKKNKNIYIYIFVAIYRPALPPAPRSGKQGFLKESGGTVEKTRTVYKDELEWKT